VNPVKNKSVSIVDIAEYLGLSHVTVSYVLSGQKRLQTSLQKTLTLMVNSCLLLALLKAIKIVR